MVDNKAMNIQIAHQVMLVHVCSRQHHRRWKQLMASVNEHAGERKNDKCTQLAVSPENSLHKHFKRKQA